jgi:ABC-type multidrug transport system ATPase subunit
MSVLNIINLSKSYGPINALSNLNIVVEQGDVLGILGPNGSGKTTTLSIILGIIRANFGDFQWFNEANNTLINNKIGALLESPNFYPYLNIIQNLRIVAEIKQLNLNREEEFNRVLQITNLHERKFSSYSSLSFGMKQRVALSALLLGDPEVLVLDEPTNGLDPQGIADIRQIIKSEAARGKTIIMASHILDEVEKVCTHAAILKKGQLIASGKVNELMASDDTILISSENIDILYDIFARSGMYKTINKNNNEINLVLTKEFGPKDVNEYAFKNGIILSKFEIKKKSLENQYLELVS